MAGGIGTKIDPKWQKIAQNISSNEVLKDSGSVQSSQKPENKSIFSLKGVLGLNQSVSLNKETSKLENQSKVLFGNLNYVEKDYQTLVASKQQELERNIQEIYTEIKKLTKTAGKLEKELEVAIDTPIIEPSEYQVTFLVRLKNLIVTMTHSFSEATLWLDSFNKRKKKKNYFWNTAKNKKTGGTQYLFSDEHSVARSAG